MWWKLLLAGLGGAALLAIGVGAYLVWLGRHWERP